jgi:hypothetical protein
MTPDIAGAGPDPRPVDAGRAFDDILTEFSTRSIDCSPFVIMGNTMPPRDPEEDEHEEEEDDEDDEEEDRAGEPPVVREPDED